MNYDLKKTALLSTLAVTVLLGATSRASAYIEIDYSIDGGARTFGASNLTTNNNLNPNLATFTADGLGGGLFDVAFTIGRTNTPGTGNQALVSQANNLVTADYSSGSHYITIYVSSTGFTQPQSPPPTTLGNASSITEDGGSTSVVFTSYADTTNTLFGTNGPSTSVSYSVSGQTGSGSQSSTSFSPNGATYSLTNIGTFTLSGGTSLTVVSGNTTVTPTPVPAGIALALSAFPILGIGWYRRRPQQGQDGLAC